MKIIVDKMPKSGNECLFKKHYNESSNHWNCGFKDVTVCSLNCGKECEYLKEKNGGGGMTENETKAVKWMKCVKDDAVVTLDHITKNEPNVSPMLYAGRKEKAEAIINGFEELEQYRSIGTVSECREAKEKQKPKTPNMWGDGYADGKLVYDMYDCPNCGESYEIDYTDYAYCPKCGQKIDRADLEKMEV